MAPGHLESAAAHLGEHPLRNLALLSLLVIVGYRVFRYLTAHLALSRAYALNNCERPPAYPHKDPIFGLDALFANLAAARDSTFTSASAQRYHDIGAHTYYTWIQGRQTVHTAEPDNVKALLATRWKDYSIAARQAILGDLLGRGIFVIEGDEWTHARARLRPSFAKEQVADLAMLEGHIQDLFSVLPRDDATVVDLQEYFLRLTLDSASEFLFGHSTNTLVRPSARDEAFGEAFTFSLFNITQKLRRGPLNRFYRKDPREDESRQICRDYVGAFVDEAMALREKIKSDVLDDEHQSGAEQEPQRYYFLKEVAKTMDDREHICDELLSLMAAGRDTTASLFSSAFHVLSRRPDIWHKLRNEIQDLDGRPPTYAQLRNLKYVKYIINESKHYPALQKQAQQACSPHVH